MAAALRFASYRVLEELGSGAVSVVYKAQHDTLGRVVAIKALRPTIAPHSPFAAQLEREAHVLAELAHPNVVFCHDFVKTTDRMYLVLEYVDGFRLSDVLTRSRGNKSRLSFDVVAHVGAEVAHGLAHAHERGVIHRDVKPQNVLLARRGQVKLVDFGIAQRERLPTADEPLTTPAPTPSPILASQVDEPFGTPAYMSPEQILGEFVDARSDVFSLGVVLYEMLAGARPFDRGDDEADRRAAAQRIRRDPPIPLRARVADVPRALERVVMRALEKLPADRWPSAEAMAEALEEFLRARVRGPRTRLVRRALARSRLVDMPDDEVSTSAVLEVEPASLRPALVGYAGLAALVVGGAIVLQLVARRGGVTPASAAEAPSSFESAPAEMGALRVVATPWADIFVDGQHVDTTPFARAIPLTPGKHYVTFVHPNAKAEKRVVTIARGDTASLDVTMDLGASVDGGS